MTAARRRSASGRKRPDAARTAPAAGSRAALLAGLVIAVVTLAVYAQAGSFGFLRYDDPKYVSDNPHVSQGLTLDGLRWAFTTNFASNWHPLTWLSHMLDWQWFGGQAGAHHMTSVVIHAATAVLLLVALLRMTGALWPAAFVAAMFALHPLHVESVAWLSERKDVLSGLFWVLTLLAYASYARRPRAGAYALTLVVYALGLLTKPMLVTLPLVLLLLDVWPLARWDLFGAARRDGGPGRATVPLRRLLIEKLPLLALAAGSSVVTFAVQRAAGSVAPTSQIPMVQRLLNAVVAYGTYVFKTLWPAALAPFYPLRALAAWQIAASLLLLLLVTAAALLWWRRRPYLAVGWLWFLGTLVPVIGIVQVGRQALADRYTYVPQIGLSIMAAWGLAEIARSPRWRAPVVALASVVLVAWTLVTWRQASHWRDGFELFGHTIRVTGENNEAETLIGIEWHFRGDLEKALARYQAALRIDPNYFLTQSNMGLCLAQLGRVDEAVPHLREAIRLNPGLADARRYLGLALAQQGRTAEAERELERSLQLEPDNAQGHYILGEVLVDGGRVAEARREFETALRLQPGLASARAALERLGAAGRSPTP